jgi:hypothetical protein
MKRFLLALVIALATYGTVKAQSGLAGAWRLESGTDSWTVMLKPDGDKLTGTVTACASNRGPIDIFEAELDGNSVKFKCRSLDGQRTLTFTGTVKGDEIQFVWEKAGSGGSNADVFFGPEAPKQFTAKRVNAIVWTGTAQDISRTGLINPNKQVANLEIKKSTDPHWRWRDIGDLTITTFVIPNRSYDVSTLLRTDEKLSFSFEQLATEGAKDDVVHCVLPRRADGTYEGECTGSSASFRRHVTLTPPGAAEAK